MRYDLDMCNSFECDKHFDCHRYKMYQQFKKEYPNKPAWLTSLEFCKQELYLKHEYYN